MSTSVIGVDHPETSKRVMVQEPPYDHSFGDRRFKLPKGGAVILADKALKIYLGEPAPGLKYFIESKQARLLVETGRAMYVKTPQGQFVYED